MTNQAASENPGHFIKIAIPQILTGSRVVFGAAAIISVSGGDLHWAAALITFGGLTDVLDGFVARKLATASPFGALFDTFTDYLCFVVAPWFLARAIVGAEGSLWLELIFGLPLLTAAIRYARSSLIIAMRSDEVRELPGLATVFFAYLPVAVVFAEASTMLGNWWTSLLLAFLVAAFSLLMVTSIRYPKLTSFRLLTLPVVLLLIVMPFVGTRPLATLMFVAGLFYVALAPILFRDKVG
jgi:CDP-diacylglycerol--serine O-phosphatidyltransferase